MLLCIFYESCVCCLQDIDGFKLLVEFAHRGGGPPGGGAGRGGPREPDRGLRGRRDEARPKRRSPSPRRYRSRSSSPKDRWRSREREREPEPGRYPGRDERNVMYIQDPYGPPPPNQPPFPRMGFPPGPPGPPMTGRMDGPPSQHSGGGHPHYNPPPPGGLPPPPSGHMGGPSHPPRPIRKTLLDTPIPPPAPGGQYEGPPSHGTHPPSSRQPYGLPPPQRDNGSYRGGPPPPDGHYSGPPHPGNAPRDQYQAPLRDSYGGPPPPGRGGNHPSSRKLCFIFNC